MSSEPRKEHRLNILGLMRVEGLVKLSSNSEGAPVVFNNVSPGGALITMSGSQDDIKKELVELIKASKQGSFIPVQLVLNNVRIPVNIVGMVGDHDFAIRISDNEKLAVLAEKGRGIFQDIYREALDKGAKEDAYVEHKILGLDFLPDDVRNFVNDPAFGAMFSTVLSGELGNVLPSLHEKVENPMEYPKLAILCQKYLASVGTDVALLVGSEMVAVQKEGGGRIKGRPDPGGEEDLPGGSAVSRRQGAFRFRGDA